MNLKEPLSLLSDEPGSDGFGEILHIDGNGIGDGSEHTEPRQQIRDHARLVFGEQGELLFKRESVESIEKPVEGISQFFRDGQIGLDGLDGDEEIVHFLSDASGIDASHLREVSGGEACEEDLNSLDEELRVLRPARGHHGGNFIDMMDGREGLELAFQADRLGRRIGQRNGVQESIGRFFGDSTLESDGFQFPGLEIEEIEVITDLETVPCDPEDGHQ
jgi:hypothetical protein